MMRYFHFLHLATLENPVLLKELRIGLREKRMFVTQLGFLIILLLVTLTIIPSMLNNPDPEQLPELGKNFFQAIYWVQFVVLGLITPGLTCGALSGERERHSLDMVLASRLSSAEIVAGKLGYAVYYVILLLFSSLPIASVAFFLGGVSPGEAAQSYLELICFGTLAALVGLFYSSRENRSNYATSQTYLTVFLGVFLLPFYVAAKSFDLSQLPPDMVLSPMSIVTILTAYSVFFLFIKATHRLKPQARNLKMMGLAFIAVYLVGLAVMLGALSGGGTFNAGDWVGVIVPGGVIHLLWVGMFCNDTDLPSTVEKQAWTRSLLSKNIFWMGFFALGLCSPAIYLGLLGLPPGASDVLAAGCLLSALYVLVFPILGRALQGMFRSSKFAVVYFTMVAASVTLPALGLLAERPGLFSGIYLSPILSLASLGEAEAYHLYLQDQQASLATVSAFVYAVLALLAGVAIQLQKRKKNVTTT